MSAAEEFEPFKRCISFEKSHRFCFSLSGRIFPVFRQTVSAQRAMTFPLFPAQKGKGMAGAIQLPQSFFLLYSA